MFRVFILFVPEKLSLFLLTTKNTTPETRTQKTHERALSVSFRSQREEGEEEEEEEETESTVLSFSFLFSLFLFLGKKEIRVITHIFEKSGTS